ncbi:RNA polymerase sigma factor [Microbacterium sp. SLBN-146]|uniref:RNA polymerase sigma factor n=1 Tax=Microbacterium sp. SLBN-146 TaxID=2768457 RepID=UPI00114E813F|nr:sigma-70 family RNA polymerase sigma factor [Microbacterium sp. SLBN-146]TQJ31068.1 RNA polymerase sigma-70 factor (ECF subfamily) [Microbacterium sp. SLBN-146]
MTSDTAEQERLFREAVFREMFTTYFPRVTRYIQRNIGDPTAAEDVASEVFQTAWHNLDPHDPFGLPWLIRTAMHKMRDAQREHYRSAAAVDSISHSVEEAAQQAIPHDERLALSDAVDRLPKKDREIVRLTYWDGLNAAEVAEVLKIREGTVWTRLHRARAALRSALGDSTLGDSTQGDSGSGGER